MAKIRKLSTPSKRRKPLSAAAKQKISQGLARVLGPTRGIDEYEPKPKKGTKANKPTPPKTGKNSIPDNLPNSKPLTRKQIREQNNRPAPQKPQRLERPKRPTTLKELTRPQLIAGLEYHRERGNKDSYNRIKEELNTRPTPNAKTSTPDTQTANDQRILQGYEKRQAQLRLEREAEARAVLEARGVDTSEWEPIDEDVMHRARKRVERDIQKDTAQRAQRRQQREAEQQRRQQILERQAEARVILEARGQDTSDWHGIDPELMEAARLRLADQIANDSTARNAKQARNTPTTSTPTTARTTDATPQINTKAIPTVPKTNRKPQPQPTHPNYVEGGGHQASAAYLNPKEIRKEPHYEDDLNQLNAQLAESPTAQQKLLDRLDNAQQRAAENRTNAENRHNQREATRLQVLAEDSGLIPNSNKNDPMNDLDDQELADFNDYMAELDARDNTPDTDTNDAPAPTPNNMPTTRPGMTEDEKDTQYFTAESQYDPDYEEFLEWQRREYSEPLRNEDEENVDVDNLDTTTDAPTLTDEELEQRLNQRDNDDTTPDVEPENPTPQPPTTTPETEPATPQPKATDTPDSAPGTEPAPQPTPAPAERPAPTTRAAARPEPGTPDALTDEEQKEFDKQAEKEFRKQFTNQSDEELIAELSELNPRHPRAQALNRELDLRDDDTRRQNANTYLRERSGRGNQGRRQPANTGETPNYNDQNQLEQLETANQQDTDRDQFNTQELQYMTFDELDDIDTTNIDPVYAAAVDDAKETINPEHPGGILDSLKQNATFTDYKRRLTDYDGLANYLQDGEDLNTPDKDERAKLNKRIDDRIKTSLGLAGNPRFAREAEQTDEYFDWENDLFTTQTNADGTIDDIREAGGRLKQGQTGRYDTVDNAETQISTELRDHIINNIGYLPNVENFQRIKRGQAPIPYTEDTAKEIRAERNARARQRPYKTKAQRAAAREQKIFNQNTRAPELERRQAQELQPVEGLEGVGVRAGRKAIMQPDLPQDMRDRPWEKQERIDLIQRHADTLNDKDLLQAVDNAKEDNGFGLGTQDIEETYRAEATKRGLIDAPEPETPAQPAAEPEKPAKAPEPAAPKPTAKPATEPKATAKPATAKPAAPKDAPKDTPKTTTKPDTTNPQAKYSTVRKAVIAKNGTPLNNQKALQTMSDDDLNTAKTHAEQLKTKNPKSKQHQAVIDAVEKELTTRNKPSTNKTDTKTDAQSTPKPATKPTPTKPTTPAKPATPKKPAETKPTTTTTKTVPVADEKLLQEYDNLTNKPQTRMTDADKTRLNQIETTLQQQGYVRTRGRIEHPDLAPVVDEYNKTVKEMMDKHGKKVTPEYVAKLEPLLERLAELEPNSDFTWKSTIDEFRDAAKMPRRGTPEQAKAKVDTAAAVKRRTDIGDDGDLVIEHTPDSGTLISGTSRGDGTAEVLKANGWKWSRNLDAWYIPRSRDTDPKRPIINKTSDDLEKAGFRVGNVIDDTKRSAADREQAKNDRAKERAAALQAKADKKQQQADAAAKQATAATQQLPEGAEPVKIGHHSEKRHRRSLERAHAAMDKQVNANKDADAAREKAQAAKRSEAVRTNPVTVGNKIERLTLELRKLENNDSPKEKVDEWRDNLAYWQGIRDQQIKDGLIPNANKDTLKVGDKVTIGNSKRPGTVTKLNSKTLQVQGVGNLPTTYKYHEITAHTPAAPKKADTTPQPTKELTAARKELDANTTLTKNGNTYTHPNGTTIEPYDSPNDGYVKYTVTSPNGDRTNRETADEALAAANLHTPKKPATTTKKTDTTKPAGTVAERAKAHTKNIDQKLYKAKTNFDNTRQNHPSGTPEYEKAEREYLELNVQSAKQHRDFEQQELDTRKQNGQPTKAQQKRLDRTEANLQKAEEKLFLLNELRDYAARSAAKKENKTLPKVDLNTTPASQIDVNTTQFRFNGHLIRTHRGGQAQELHQKLTDRNYPKSQIKTTTPEIKQNPTTGTYEITNLQQVLGLDRVEGEAGTHRNGQYIGATDYQALTELTATINPNTGKVTINNPTTNININEPQLAGDIETNLQKHGGITKLINTNYPNSHISGQPIKPNHLTTQSGAPLNPADYPTGAIRIDKNKVHIGNYTLTDHKNGTYTISSKNNAPLDVGMKPTFTNFNTALTSIANQAGPTHAETRKNNTQLLTTIKRMEKIYNKPNLTADELDRIRSSDKIKDNTLKAIDKVKQLNLPEYDQKTLNTLKANVEKIHTPDTPAPTKTGTPTTHKWNEPYKTTLTDGAETRYYHTSDWNEPHTPSDNMAVWNSQRPLQGQYTWQGQGRYGQYYAATPTNHADYTTHNTNNLNLDSERIELVDNTQSLELADQRLQELRGMTLQQARDNGATDRDLMNMVGLPYNENDAEKQRIQNRRRELYNQEQHQASATELTAGLQAAHRQQTIGNQSRFTDEGRAAVEKFNREHPLASYEELASKIREQEWADFQNADDNYRAVSVNQLKDRNALNPSLTDEYTDAANKNGGFPTSVANTPQPTTSDPQTTNPGRLNDEDLIAEYHRIKGNKQARQADLGRYGNILTQLRARGLAEIPAPSASGTSRLVKLNQSGEELSQKVQPPTAPKHLDGIKYMEQTPTYDAPNPRKKQDRIQQVEEATSKLAKQMKRGDEPILVKTGDAGFYVKPIGKNEYRVWAPGKEYEAKTVRYDEPGGARWAPFYDLIDQTTPQKHTAGEPFTNDHKAPGETLNPSGSLRRGDYTIVSTPDGYQILENFGRHKITKPYKQTLSAIRKKIDQMPGNPETN